MNLNFRQEVEAEPIKSMVSKLWSIHVCVTMTLMVTMVVKNVNVRVIQKVVAKLTRWTLLVLTRRFCRL